MTASLQARVLARLERAPEGRALTFIDATGAFEWRSVEQVYRRALAFGETLTARGCGAGDVCVMVLPSDEFAATVLLATLLRGAIPLLVAPPVLQGGGHSSLRHILDGILSRTTPRLVVGDRSLETEGDGLRRAHPTTTFLFGEASFAAPAPGRLEPPVLPAETATAALQLTSGTTGFPRICRWQQRNVLAALDGMAAAMALGEDDVCLNWTPLYHDMGLVNNFLLCLTHGVPLVMLSPTDFVRRPARWLRGLSDTGATVTWSPNFGYAIAAERVRDAELAGVRLDHVRSFWNAAERIHVETVRAFRDRFAPYGVRPEALKMNFGCAENVGGATFTSRRSGFEYERVDTRALHEDRVARPVAARDATRPTTVIVGAGRPHPALRVRIASEDGRPLPDGHVGEVLLDTPSRMTEYVGQPEETAHALENGFVRTGDLGYLRDGELFWTGRVRERITVRGRKIDPSELEGPLWSVADLRPGCFVAFGVPDARLGTERIVIVAELRPESRGDHRDIAAAVRLRVSEELGVPVSDVVLVHSGTLAKTSSGKRRHVHFRDLYVAGALETLYAGDGPGPAVFDTVTGQAEDRVGSGGPVE